MCCKFLKWQVSPKAWKPTIKKSKQQVNSTTANCLWSSILPIAADHHAIEYVIRTAPKNVQFILAQEDLTLAWASANFHPCFMAMHI